MPDTDPTPQQINPAVIDAATPTVDQDRENTAEQLDTFFSDSVTKGNVRYQITQCHDEESPDGILITLLSPKNPNSSNPHLEAGEIGCISIPSMPCESRVEVINILESTLEDGVLSPKDFSNLLKLIHDSNAEFKMQLGKATMLPMTCAIEVSVGRYEKLLNALTTAAPEIHVYNIPRSGAFSLFQEQGAANEAIGTTDEQDEGLVWIDVVDSIPDVHYSMADIEKRLYEAIETLPEGSPHRRAIEDLFTREGFGIGEAPANGHGKIAYFQIRSMEQEELSPTEIKHTKIFLFGSKKFVICYREAGSLIETVLTNATDTIEEAVRTETGGDLLMRPIEAALDYADRLLNEYQGHIETVKYAQESRGLLGVEGERVLSNMDRSLGYMSRKFEDTLLCALNKLKSFELKEQGSWVSEERIEAATDTAVAHIKKIDELRKQIEFRFTLNSQKIANNGTIVGSRIGVLGAFFVPIAVVDSFYTILYISRFGVPGLLAATFGTAALVYYAKRDGWLNLLNKKISNRQD